MESHFMGRNFGRGLAAAALLVLPGSNDAAAQEPRVVTLAEAVQLALATDPAAVAAHAAVRGAEADLLQARGAWLPSLSFGSTYLNASSQRVDQTTGQIISQGQPFYTAQAQAGIDVFTGGARFARHAAASADLAANEARLSEQRFQTILQTTESYFAVAAAAELERAAQQRRERALQQLEFARTRLEVGTATASDVLRAEIEVGNAELAVLDAESALRGAGLNLGRRIGLPELVLADPAALPDRGPALPEVAQLVEHATRSAPLVRAAEATLRGRQAARWMPLTQYLPALRVGGGYNWRAAQFPPQQRNWSFQVTASLPLLDGFQREAALTRLSAAEATAQARARDAVLAVRAAVETAAYDIAAAERRVEIADRGLELAREDLRVQEERYRLGVATILDLQASQLALTEAEVVTVRARQVLGLAVARLEALLGETLADVTW
jgi:outer membrane protein